MNVIFISPNFPDYYYNFVVALRKKGVNVLGIGDAPYDSLNNDLKESIGEYYKVNSLEAYDDVYRAVGFFIGKYGRIDYIESQNEYWLELEAKLRKDFNITSGPKPNDLKPMKYKSLMKEVYIQNNIKVAPYKLIKEEKDITSFVRKVKYPIVIKPDNGVGAVSTYKLNKRKDVNKFLETHDLKDRYIVEQYIPGLVETFDGLTDSKKNVLICSNHVMLDSIMDTVNDHIDISFYNHYVSDDIKEIGLKTVKAFNTKKKFFHFEFIRLSKDVPNLGNKGELVALEVNMRAPGAFIPDMIDFAYDTSIYDLFAQMLVDDKIEDEHTQKYCIGYAGRHYDNKYAYSNQQIKMKYKDEIVLNQNVPEPLNQAMGDLVYIVKAKNEEKVKEIIEFILEK
ncbi:MAG: ATP-grasp domain-containing protein [Thomasclavelia sp.]|nr:ATP-grasp domain-containing protein [Thomasclavelia sp.]